MSTASLFATMTDALAQLHLLRPQWLWALLALPPMIAWWRLRQRRRSVWREAVDPHLLPHLLERDAARGARWAPWPALLCYVLAVCALAGPSWRQGEQPLLQGQAPLVIALDLSSATLAGDLPPSRLLQARAKIATLLRTRAGGQVGLVVFADDAFTVAPLTEDAGNVALFLDALTPDIMPVDGSRAERAIERSAELLRRAGFARGDILVLSDRASDEARAAAQTAARAGYRVSVLGLGTAQGAAYRRVDGSIARARRDDAALRALAAAGDGRYRALAADDGDLGALGLLDPAAAQATDAVRAGGRVWRDEGYWLLLPLMLLALLAFRRGSALALLLCCLWLPAPPAAAESKPAEATLWQRADQAAHARMREGEAAYRRDDYADALRAWQGLAGADAAYNRGNALARQQRYEDAIAAYDEALRLQPGMADAIANRAAVMAAMQRQPPPGPGADKRGEQDADPQGGRPKSGQGDPDGKRGQRDDDALPPSPAEKNASGAGSPPPPADEAAQREADAAQRERMQRALQDARDADDGAEQPGDLDRAETAAERERRRADDAWLKRVPDDPGGLLRAKFRLEHERRQRSGAD